LSDEDIEKVKKWLNVALEKAEKDKSENPNNQVIWIKSLIVLYIIIDISI